MWKCNDDRVVGSGLICVCVCNFCLKWGNGVHTDDHELQVGFVTSSRVTAEQYVSRDDVVLLVANAKFK